MSTTTLHVYIVLHFYLLLFLFPIHEAMAGRSIAGRRAIPSSGPSTMMPILASEARESATMKMKPRLNKEGKIFHGKEVKACMPKGRRRSSAPSRFVNFHTFDDLLGCETGRRQFRNP